MVNGCATTACFVSFKTGPKMKQATTQVGESLLLNFDEVRIEKDSVQNHDDAVSESSASTQDPSPLQPDTAQSRDQDAAAEAKSPDRVSDATTESIGDNAAATPDRVSDATDRLSDTDFPFDERAARKPATTALETLGTRSSDTEHVEDRVDPPTVHEIDPQGDAASADRVQPCLIAAVRQKSAVRTIAGWWRSSRQPESELAKVLALRRAATSYQNEPHGYVGDKPDSRKVSFADEIGAPLEERDSGGSAEQFQVADHQGAPEAQPLLVSTRNTRFDFGVGLVRGCEACKSRLPRLNRGCKTCQKRVCRKCFLTHACSVFASAQDLPTADARSTPSIAH